MWTKRSIYVTAAIVVALGPVSAQTSAGSGGTVPSKWTGALMISQTVVEHVPLDKEMTVTMPRGTIYVLGTTGDSITWQTVRASVTAQMLAQQAIRDAEVRVAARRVAADSMHATIHDLLLLAEMRDLAAKSWRVDSNGFLVPGQPGRVTFPLPCALRPSGAWILQSPDSDGVHVDLRPATSDANESVVLCVTVPHNLRLLRLKHGGGEIQINGFDGDLEIESDSGDVHGDRLGGGVVIEARHGGVDVGLSATTGPRRPVSLMAGDGPILLRLPSIGATARGSLCGTVRPDSASSDPRRDVVSYQTFTSRSAPWQEVETFGIAPSAMQCSSANRPINNSIAGSWSKGGATVRLETLRGTISLTGS